MNDIKNSTALCSEANDFINDIWRQLTYVPRVLK